MEVFDKGFSTLANTLTCYERVMLIKIPLLLGKL